MSLSPSGGARPHRFRTLLMALAALYAAATLLYSGLWLSTRYSGVELGYESDWISPERGQHVRVVAPNSPAQKAGLRAGDYLVAIDGRRLETARTQPNEWKLRSPGSRVRLTILRPGEQHPLTLEGTLRRRTVDRSESGWVAQEFQSLRPAPFMAVGLAVLFLRLESGAAWLLALLFGDFASIAGMNFDQLNPPWDSFAVVYHSLAMATCGPLFYWFFAVFPVRSPIDRRLPWFKFLLIAIGLWMAPTGFAGSGTLRAPYPFSDLMRPSLSQNIAFYFVAGSIVLGLVSAAWNFRTAEQAGSRRKIRVVFWGALLGVGPPLAGVLFRNATGRGSPPWIAACEVAVLFLWPLSTAYAVVKHQVLEIPILLRRSARYLLVQRGFTFALSISSIGLTLLFAAWFSERARDLVAPDGPMAVSFGAIFGTGLLWGGTVVHRRVSGVIDRAFFRSAYDARMILEDLAARIRTVTGRAELAALLEARLNEALKPASLSIFLDSGTEGVLHAAAGPAATALPAISSDAPPLTALPETLLSEEGAQWGELARLDPACLVPVIGRGQRLAGLLVLGPRLSEDLYSREDIRLLESVAGQAGTALENMRLAEQMAERMELERRAAREMEIAKDVQTRLLPEKAPALETLECAAACVQARAVGGDYYDFIELPEARTALVLADISGKGVHAALLMANLQAHLRSQAPAGWSDPVGMLRRVNRMLWQSTAARHYATLFFGIYDDRARLLRYVNCGHNPPLVLRAGGAIDHLEATATVIGVFENWNGKVGETALAPGDVLAIYSDGVTEAMRADDEEYGERRLTGELSRNAARPAAEIVNAVLSSVQSFSGPAQSDDLTLLVARARA
jgi:phosphoserine phosphatase RsbU/P